MSKLKLRATVQGSAEVTDALKGIKLGVRNRVLKAACKTQATKAAKVAKMYVRGKRSGQLAKSIGQVYRKYKGGLVWVFVAGPRKGFRIKLKDATKAGRKKYLKKYADRLGRALTGGERDDLLGRWVDPVKYGHFVEGGRKAVRAKPKTRAMSDGITVFGRASRAVTPHPFMEPAAAAVAGSRDQMTREIWTGLLVEAARYAKKGKTVHA